MATYNGAEYIGEQLQSFMAQSCRPDELIVSDDGSVDNTREIVEEFAKSASFPVVFSRNVERLGYAGNFSRALSLTSGEIVFLSDQDDVWFPDKLSTIKRAFEDDSQALLIMNDAELADSKLLSSGLTKLGQIKSAGLSESSFAMGCCIAIRKDLLRLLVPIPRVRRSHDEWLVQFARGLKRIRLIPVPLQYYRRHGRNESRFFVNSTKKISLIYSRYQRLLIQFKQLGSKSEVEITLNEQRACLDRIQQYDEQFGKIAGSENLTEFVRCTMNRVDVLSQRQNLRKNRNIIKRWFAVASLWRRGSYRGLGGVFQIINDCIF